MVAKENNKMDNSSDLVECRNCGRHFNQQAIGRHEPICVKTGQKKRKVFDSSKQRAEGTELKQFIKKGPQSKSLGQTSGLRGNDAPVGIRRAGAQPSKSNWRLKHEELIQSLRAAKQAQHAIATGQPLPPPPPPSLNPDYVGCPYCNRRFNEKAAQRHISFCKEQHERLPTKKTIDNTTATRANARTNYKAPKPRGGKTATSAQMYDDDDMYNTRGGYSAGVSSTRGGYRESEPGQGRVLRTGRTPETYSEARELSAQQRATMSVKKAPVKQPLRPPQNDNGYYSNSDDSSSYTATSGGRGGGYGGGGYGSSTGGYGGYGGNNIGGGSGGSGGGYGSGSSMYGARNGSGRGMNARGGIGGSGSSAIGRGYDSIGSRNAAPVHSSSSTGKFCGNCGAGYPTVQAKFCSECGSRRS